MFDTVNAFSIQADGYDDAKPGPTRQRSDSDTNGSSDTKGRNKKFVWRSDTRKRGVGPGAESDKDSNGGFFDGFFSAKSTGLVKLRNFQFSCAYGRPFCPNF